MSLLRRYLPLVTVAIAISFLYLHKLDAVGVLSADEPRYAAIGRAMAQSHGFITPDLWGQPWFEKPPLLYWMTALGAISGLNPDLAGRLPVAFLSLAFLVTAFLLLKREFGIETASAATAMLATSAGWLAYSEVCVTDVPLSIFFSLALLLALPLLRNERHANARLLLIGISLALATLAKGLVPLALAPPGAYFLRHYWRRWWLILLGFLPVATPWYIAMYVRFGNDFIQEFFVRHHFQRLYSASLQHVQPLYYYIPVLLAALFPWTPALALLALRRSKWDSRRRFLSATVLFGFVLFSVSRNKLPGYLLPLIPPLFILIGAHFEEHLVSPMRRIVLLLCAVCISLIPLLIPTVAASLSAGRFAWSNATLTRTTLFYIVAPLSVVLLARRSYVGPLLVLCLVSSGLYLKAMLYPVLDRSASARGLWLSLEKDRRGFCDAGMRRDWVYGLSFYAGHAIPGCLPNDGRLHVHSSGHSYPVVSDSR